MSHGSQPAPVPCPTLRAPDPAHITRLSRLAASRYKVQGMAPEDLQQEAVLAMLQAEPGQGDRALLDLARVRLQALYRTGERHRTEPLADPTDVIDPHGEADDEPAFDMDRVLSLLPERQALVLELEHRQGLCDNEIASALGCSQNAVRQMRARALRTLRENLPEGAA